MQHRLVRTALISLITAAVVAGCGSDDDRARTTSSTAPVTSSGSTVSAPPAAITVAGGQVQGQAELSFDEDSEVVFEVSSDSEDQVHVHGYDVLVPVGPGKPGTVRFTADVPGIFEVELEAAGKKLTSLRIS